MDPNSVNQNRQFIVIQQGLLQLEQIVTQSSTQSSAEPQTSLNIHMDANNEETISALHSLRIRPSCSWSPTPFLTEVLALDSLLFTTTMLPDDERRKLIDQYPNINLLILSQCCSQDKQVSIKARYVSQTLTVSFVRCVSTLGLAAAAIPQ
ncbi:hypothetical protein INT47_002225 [Mucor saturninus]|uniref:Uncharacterized protein n=1 Tax=Mucor saturninus TaxID=64648 RepID=A0A8H7V040_9FUNG|nr:hypothetical protein INT47_002225 [Mucor saturninus]